MGSLPLAFSIHNFVSSVGADAGFAAIIGLAILVLLYFAHARETANLREQAALLSQRLQAAEARVAQLSRAHPVAPPPAAQAARAAAPASPYAGATAGPLPGAPAGVAAPALAAATRVVPVASPAMDDPAVPAPAVAEPAVTGVTAQPVAAGMVAGATLSSPPPRATPDMRTPPPAGAAAGQGGLAPPQEELDDPVPAGTGNGSESTPAPGPATVAGANGGRYERPAAPVGAGPSPPPASAGSGTRPVLPPAGGRRPLPPIEYPVQRRSRSGRRVAVLIALLAFVAVIAVLVVVTSGGGANKTSSTTAASNAPRGHNHRRPAARPAAFSPASVTVAVLNGTATNYLAHTVGAKLTAMGYKQGNLATASNQTETATVVSYRPGAANKTDALHVAASLKLGPASVQPIDQSTQQVACPPPAACTANVVVTVGADLANL